MNGHFDFLVVGEDEASFAAAAAAAKAGARVAMLVPPARKKRARAAAPAIANFVWRRLDLQDYDLTLEPVSARITLFKSGAPLVSYANPRETMAALATQGIADHPLWRDFLEDMAALATDLEYPPAGYVAASSTAQDGKAFAALLTNPDALVKAARLFGSCADILGDYFQDRRFKTHLAAHALGSAGRGDQEAGAAEILTAFFDPDAWRVRASRDGPSLLAVLEQACHDCGVVMSSDRPLSLLSSAKSVQISFGGEEKIRVKHILFASPDAARAMGATDPNGALGAAANAEFTVRFRLKDALAPPHGDANAIFQVIDDHADIQAARDAALQGRIYERIPIEFEFTANGEIIARSSYLPAAFFEDGEWRGWTGQDRQAVASMIKERLSSRMPEFASLIRRTESDLAAPPAIASLFSVCNRVIVQPHRHHAISAAVKLVDQVMTSDE